MRRVFRGRFQRLLDDLCDLRVGDAARYARAVRVREPLDPMLSETSAPFAYCVFGVTKLSSELFAGQTLCAAQDNPASVRQRTLRLVLTQMSLQKTAHAPPSSSSGYESWL
jgi:hypothetical protein